MIGRQGALCGNIRFVRGKFHATEHAVVVTPKDGIDTRWLYYLLVLANLNQYATGQAQPGLSVKNLDKLRFTIPHDDKEQQQIATCLTSVDDLITAANKKMTALQAHKKGLLQQLFPAKGERVPEVRFEGFDGEWEEDELQGICHLKAGEFVRSSEISDKNGEGLFPCYGGNGLRGYVQSYNNKGDYSLIGRQGALCGNITFVTGEFHATEHAVVVTPKNNIDTKWLFYLLVRADLNQYATGQAQPGLSVKNLDRLRFAFPHDPKEQQKIATCLSSLDDLITAQSEKIATLKVHKKGLMQQLFPNPNEMK